MYIENDFDRFSVKVLFIVFDSKIYVALIVSKELNCISLLLFMIQSIYCLHDHIQFVLWS